MSSQSVTTHSNKIWVETSLLPPIGGNTQSQILYVFLSDSTWVTWAGWVFISCCSSTPGKPLEGIPSSALSDTFPPDSALPHLMQPYWTELCKFSPEIKSQRKRERCHREQHLSWHHRGGKKGLWGNVMVKIVGPGFKPWLCQWLTVALGMTFSISAPLFLHMENGKY